MCVCVCGSVVTLGDNGVCVCVCVCMCVCVGQWSQWVIMVCVCRVVRNPVIFCICIFVSLLLCSGVFFPCELTCTVMRMMSLFVCTYAYIYECTGSGTQDQIYVKIHTFD